MRLGNRETYPSISGGYRSAENRTPLVILCSRLHEYMVTPGDPDNLNFADSCYRLDYGPVTSLTLDSTNGLPDEDVSSGILSGEIFSGDDTNLTPAPPNHEFADDQSGVAMRTYTPMFDEYGVAAVISGHDEMFEHSLVDSDGDGVGSQVNEVGVAAHGLRGEQLYETEDGSYAPIRFNTHSQWMAVVHEPEI